MRTGALFMGLGAAWEASQARRGEVGLSGGRVRCRDGRRKMSYADKWGPLGRHNERGKRVGRAVQAKVVRLLGCGERPSGLRLPTGPAGWNQATAAERASQAK